MLEKSHLNISMIGGICSNLLDEEGKTDIGLYF